MDSHIFQSYFLNFFSYPLNFLGTIILSRSVVYNSLWPLDCSPPGSFVLETLQARTLEWVAISSSRGSNSCLLHCRWVLYHLCYQRSPLGTLVKVNWLCMLFVWDSSSTDLYALFFFYTENILSWSHNSNIISLYLSTLFLLEVVPVNLHLLNFFAHFKISLSPVFWDYD